MRIAEWHWPTAARRKIPGVARWVVIANFAVVTAIGCGSSDRTRTATQTAGTAAPATSPADGAAIAESLTALDDARSFIVTVHASYETEPEPVSVEATIAFQAPSDLQLAVDALGTH